MCFCTKFIDSIKAKDLKHVKRNISKHLNYIAKELISLLDTPINFLPVSHCFSFFSGPSALYHDGLHLLESRMTEEYRSVLNDM